MDPFNGQGLEKFITPSSAPAPPPDNPSSPEAPAPKRFQVRVEDPDILYQAVQGGVSGELGRLLLEDPLKSISINLRSDGKEFNLVGELVSGVPYSPMAQIDRDNFAVLTGICRAAAEKYRKLFPQELATERGGQQIIKTPGGRKIILNPYNRGMKKGFYITTGLIWEPDKSLFTQIYPAPPSTRESFDGTLEDFIEVLKVTLETAHRTVGKEVTGEELVLRGPNQLAKPEIGGFGSGFGFPKTFNEEQIPEELLGKLEIGKSDIRFGDIGGNQGAKKEIEGLAFALKNPELYKKWGTKPPKGILLFGPPGTGKTLWAKALAAQTDARFFHVEAADIASKWYGDSEKIIKSIFALANKNGGKTIIFFDEIDAIAPQREGTHEVTRRVISTLLENMDGLAANDNVMVVASTNRLEGIEPAMLRAGRFDRWIEVPVPDEEGRKQILGIHIAKAEQIAGRKLFGEVNLEALIAKTEKSSGADLAEIIRRVLEEKVRQEGTTGQEPGLADTKDILRELEGYEKVKTAKKTTGFNLEQHK